jgi:hypothetical protein
MQRVLGFVVATHTEVDQFTVEQNFFAWHLISAPEGM